MTRRSCNVDRAPDEQAWLYGRPDSPNHVRTLLFLFHRHLERIGMVERIFQQREDRDPKADESDNEKSRNKPLPVAVKPTFSQVRFERCLDWRNATGHGHSDQIL